MCGINSSPADYSSHSSFIYFFQLFFFRYIGHSFLTLIFLKRHIDIFIKTTVHATTENHNELIEFFFISKKCPVSLLFFLMECDK